MIEQYIETDYEFAPPYLKDILVKDDKLISNDQVKELIFILARFLESYQNNPWLNLLSSMCRLITKSFDNPDGKVRLYNFITEAKKSSHNWSATLENLLDFAKVLNDEDKLVLSEVLEPHLENDEELIMLHKYLQDDYSAIKYLEKFNKRLEKVY
jgi:ATP-dependent DNA helicase RecQ